MTITTITEINIANNRFCLYGSHDRLCGQNFIKKKKVVGIGFLVVAVAVLYFGLVGWPSLDVNIWALFPVGLFLFFTLENLVKKDYKASLMSLIIAFIIANAIFDILPLSSGLVIGAGVLACVGIGFLFPEKNIKAR